MTGGLFLCQVLWQERQKTDAKNKKIKHTTKQNKCYNRENQGKARNRNENRHRWAVFKSHRRHE